MTSLSQAGQVHSRPTSVEDMVRRSHWIVVAEPCAPAHSSRVAIDPDTHWETEYRAGHYRVHHTLLSPSEETLPKTSCIDVVSNLLQTWENLGERASSKGIIGHQLAAEEPSCPDSGPRILFLGSPNLRGEYPATISRACLPVSDTGRVKKLVETSTLPSADPIERTP